MAITAPDVIPQPIPSVREQPAADAAAFGGGPGLQAVDQEVQKVATGIGGIAAMERMRVDQTAVEEAQAKASKLTTDILYDPKTGVLGSQGKNALQAQKDGLTRFQKGMNDISQGLNGENQVGAFNKWALAQSGVVNHTMMVHVDEQLKKHDAESLDNLVANQAGLAALSHGNPDALKLAFGTVNDNVQAYAARNRMDEDQSKRLSEKVNDTMHTAVVEAMLKFHQDGSAGKYYSEHKDEISPAQREKLSVALEEGTMRSQSQKQADAIWATSKGDLRDALQKVSGIQDAKLRDETRTRVKQFASDNELAIHYGQEQAYLQGAKLTENIKNPAAVRDAIPPYLWTQMGPQHQQALLRRSSDEPNDDVKWNEFMEMARNPDNIANLSQADFSSRFTDHFDDRHRERAEQMRVGASRGVDTAVIPKHMIDDTLSGTGIIPGFKPGKKLSRSDAQAYAAFEQTATDEIMRWQQTQTKKANPEEIQKVLDGMVMKNYFAAQKPGIFSQAANLIMSPIVGQRKAVPFDTIPDTSRQALTQAARRFGASVSRDKMERAYFAALKGDDKAVASILKE